MTRNEFIKKAKLAHSSLYLYDKIESAVKARDLVRIGCKVHGYFDQTASSHYGKMYGCPKCGALKISSARSMTCIEFLRRAQIKFPGYTYKLPEEFKGTSSVRVTCSIGHRYKTVANNHLSDKGNCQKCLHGIRLTSRGNSFVNKAIKVHNGKYGYSKTEYIDTYQKVVIECPKHGDFLQEPVKHLQGSGCHKCAPITAALTKSDSAHRTLIERLLKVHGSKYSYEDLEYNGWKKSINISCPKHGSFSQLISNHLRGYGCHKCTSETGIYSSKIEKKVQKWCRGLVPNVVFNTRDIIRPLELDIWFPRNKLAIEVNGLYWHSDAHKASGYHLDKTRKCRKKGIQLLQFWENELLEQGPVIRSIIKSKLGLTEVIGARKCSVVWVSNKRSRNFLKSNHRQGSINSEHCVGLELEGKLVALMTFGKPQFNKNYEWELLRFCNLLDTTVVGGASRLLKAFEKKCVPSSLVSYADRRYSEGDVYKQLGFTLESKSKPGFFYTRAGSTVSRYGAQKHKLSKLLGNSFLTDISANKNMQLAGYNRVYDCGNLVFSKQY